MIQDVDRGGVVAISYARGDKPSAQRLAGLLNRFRAAPSLLETQTRYGFAPARFHAKLLPHLESETDVDLHQATKLTLRDADHLVVLASKLAAADRWVEEEIRTFSAYRRSDARDQRIHLVLLPGDPEKAAPTALAEAGLAPVADVSADKDGWDVGARKAIASLSGVSLATLDAADRERGALKIGGVVRAVLAGAAVAAAALGGYAAIAAL